MKREFETFFLPSEVTFFPLESGTVLDLNAKFVALHDMEFLADYFGIWRQDEGPAASACFAIRPD